mgnify:CR=1 FL=1
MKTNQIIFVVALATVIISAMVCDIVRRRKYTPSAQLNELKQPLSLEYATRDNTVDTYTNIDKLLPQLLRDIYHAKEYVLFQFFKFENDSLGLVVREELINKAQEGVSKY